MNHSQWLWEYHALQLQEEKRDKEIALIFKAASRVMLETLISVLGLRFAKETVKADAQNEVEQDDARDNAHANDPTKADKVEPFTPLSLLVAKYERLHEAQRDMALENKIEKATEKDTPFDKLSEAIATGDMDGDLAPFLDMIEGRISKDDYQDLVDRRGDEGSTIEDNTENSTGDNTEYDSTSLLSEEELALLDPVRIQMRELGIEVRPDDAPEAVHIGTGPRKG